MKIALIPFRAIVGDLEGNLSRTKKNISEAQAKGAELIVFPELSLIGYPPQDILLRPAFLAETQKQLMALQSFLNDDAKRKQLGVIVGSVLESPQKVGNRLLNCAVFLHNGKLEYRAKSLIPHYDVFDELRYFESALHLEDKNFSAPVVFQDKKLGILICEDHWHQLVKYDHNLYNSYPAKHLQKAGAEVLINISASPYAVDKKTRRREVVCQTAKELKLPTYYVNHYGANDEIIFDGDAFFVTEQGKITAEQVFSQEIFYLTSAKHAANIDQLEELQEAIIVGIREYAQKNGFTKACLGISGGIDSALVATLASLALGPKNVIGFSLPSKVSSTHSIEDAEALVKNLGIQYKNFPIRFLQSTFLMALKPYFDNRPEDVTEENLQSRLRAISLMAMSNKFNYLLLSTGNKSELATGYTTLYGDMCGALLPIGDLYKMQVYELARFINRKQEIIPARSISKVPSAELRPNQTDQDTLPSYEVLDAILYQLVDEERGAHECYSLLKSKKISKETILEVEKMLWKAEFKRYQAAPILRLSNKAFGIGRRYPLTARVPRYN